MWYYLLIEIVLLSCYGMFGMALMPDAARFDGENGEGGKIVPFMLAPLLGAAVWLAVSVFFGMLLPYNGFLFAALTLFSAGFIFVRRQRLFFVCDEAVCLFVLASAILSLLVMYGVIPHKIGSGIYFTRSAYDHVKTAIVHSISANGLPPLNPWLADGGKPLIIAYYFGWHAWAAQLAMLSFVSSLDAEAVMTGFTALLSLLTVGAFCVKLTKRKISLLFLFLLSCSSSITNAQIQAILPKALHKIFSVPNEVYWTFVDNTLWSPQHEFSAAVVLIVLYLYTLLLKSRDKRQSLELALLLGLLAAAAFFTSVYAGIFALLLFVLLLIPIYLTGRNFRKDFNASFVFQLSAAAFALLLSAMFIRYMLRYYPESSPIAFGVTPYYMAVSGFAQIVKHWCYFYLFVLPCRLSLPYILGIAAILLPHTLPEDRLAKLGKYFTLLLLAVIFVVHSTFYSNDFGWRTPTAAFRICSIFAAVLCVKIYDALKKSGTRQASTFIVLLICFPLLYHHDLTSEFITKKSDPQIHTAFAEAAKGWSVIREHTGKNEIVMCSPKSFENMPNQIFGKYTNIFFSFYAERYTALADQIFSKCYSEYYSEKKLNARYARTVYFFKGNPSADDVAYAADTQKIKAILVTPYDGLWKNCGALETRYRKVKETEYYRVYVKKETAEN